MFLPETIIKISLQDTLHSYKSVIPLEAWNLKSGKKHSADILDNNP